MGAVACLMKRPFDSLEHLGAGAVLCGIERDLMLVGRAVGEAYGQAALAKFIRAQRQAPRADACCAFPTTDPCVGSLLGPSSAAGSCAPDGFLVTNPPKGAVP